MTVIELQCADSLRCGGIPCLRCSVGWYLWRRADNMLVCAVCGYQESLNKLELMTTRVKALVEHQRRLEANFKFYVPGGRPAHVNLQ